MSEMKPPESEHGGALSINRAEVDIQITTARRYPRSITEFKREALAMATLDEETAGSMFYVLPRAGKRIEGPSVRLAEIVASALGNIKCGARIVEVGPKYVTAQGVAWDLQKNVSASIDVQRRITRTSGERYDDDMIGTTSNAATSIAFRQAIFKVVPFSYIKDIYEHAKAVSIGKGRSMESRREAAFTWFTKLGATPAQLITLLGRKGSEDLTEDDLIVLRGLSTAIRDGDTTWDQVWREFQAPTPKPEGSPLDQLTASLRAQPRPSIPTDAGTGVGNTARVDLSSSAVPIFADGVPPPDRRAEERPLPGSMVVEGVDAVVAAKAAEGTLLGPPLGELTAKPKRGRPPLTKLTVAHPQELRQGGVVPTQYDPPISVPRWLGDLGTDAPTLVLLPMVAAAVSIEILEALEDEIYSKAVWRTLSDDDKARVNEALEVKRATLAAALP